MIYFESNMNARDSYTVANTEDLDISNLASSITPIARVIKYLSEPNISIKFLKLLPYNVECYHILNMQFLIEKDGEKIIQYLDSLDEICEETLIRDFNDVRVICFNRLSFIGDKHYMILPHREQWFDKPTFKITIFVDSKFNELDDETNNREMLELVGDCIDTYISTFCGINVNYYRSVPDSYTDVTGDIEAIYGIRNPAIIIRNQMNSYDINFIVEYLQFFIRYSKECSLIKEDILSYLKGKGIFADSYFEVFSDIIDNMYSSEINFQLNGSNSMEVQKENIQYVAMIRDRMNELLYSSDEV